LIQKGADVQATNRYDVRPLSLACQNGNAAIVGRLLAAGANPNTTLRGSESALTTAARTGRPGPIRLLIEHGADVDAKDRKDQTAIMWAAAEGNLAAVELLLQAGADYKTPLDSGFTPFFFAVRAGHIDVARRLLKAGIDVTERMSIRKAARKGPDRGTTALHLAVENGHFELAGRLLDAGADPNDDGPGYTALHAITWVRKPKRGDGDPPPPGSGSWTSMDLVRHLLESGADPNARHRRGSSGRGRLNYKGATPLLMAAETGDLELIRVLVAAGADPLSPNVEHCTPLLAACGVGVLSDGDESAGTEDEAMATAEYLLDLGADIDAVDDHGKTVMHGAAFKSWPRLVTFLAERGADIDVWNRKNDHGWTPLMIAQGHRHGNFRPSAETIRAIEAAASR
jgi:ankyrin repeat protein